MRAQMIVIPSSPALVAELAVQDDPCRQLVARARELLGRLDGQAPIDLVGSRDRRWRTEHTGSFAAWGAPQVQVDAGNYLAELVCRYVLGQHTERIRRVSSCLDAVDPAALTIVSVDGSAGLTSKAPLSLIPTAADSHRWCTDLLAGRACPPRSERWLRDAGVVEPRLWCELQGLKRVRGELIAADTSTGVGRYLALIEVAVDAAQPGHPAKRGA
ncbi:hypothetical protein [Corynebacterium atypicum]|uniref:hypothetical protein n=1 Tax=Corynebacterium atypicum TaxID=191610 RepID=UPI00068D0165|nr:hypothetical protein [Corynebacterium atypicum]